jgi:hypothetical protein
VSRRGAHGKKKGKRGGNNVTAHARTAKRARIKTFTETAVADAFRTLARLVVEEGCVVRVLFSGFGRPWPAPAGLESLGMKLGAVGRRCFVLCACAPAIAGRAILSSTDLRAAYPALVLPQDRDANDIKLDEDLQQLAARLNQVDHARAVLAGTAAP